MNTRCPICGGEYRIFPLLSLYTTVVYQAIERELEAEIKRLGTEIDVLCSVIGIDYSTDGWGRRKIEAVENCAVRVLMLAAWDKRDELYDRLSAAKLECNLLSAVR